ncbi:HAD family phosphatase [Candidatus Woesearchaeota archaeon]|nr:HAD family phosphatase [Candidatus Woesearchaeota archaeon]
MIKAVIFDLDGVLIDSEELHRKTWNKALEKYGVELSKGDFSNNYFGKRGVDIIMGLKQKYGIRVSKEEIPKMVRDKNTYFRQEFGKEQIMPGSEILARNLKRKGYKIALGTSTTKENVDFFRTVLKAFQYFDDVVCADDVSKGKPDPEMFIKAAQKLKVAASDCVVIEDAPHGIEAAKRAGMKCIAVATTHKPSELANADMIVKDLSQLTVEKIGGLENDK